ncbi:helix-turn-helix domain-containing protein [Desulfovibrio sp. UCD-KL4C]|uniref:helix-turn-helix domain-containing protein n=1 Tax=Desulfovibrio sp. UCD-KL4C TaxID=2578120 RepID=UPI0025C65663|nr:helix-turn-helix domain-containing protein [Desulfovibrio sp. UCD-KL4C]
MEKTKISLLRSAAQVLGKDGDIFYNHLLYKALGAESDKEKARVRRQANQLVETGEFSRVARGKYKYHPEKAPKRDGKLTNQMWRAIRSSQPGWTMAEIAQISGASLSHVVKYCRYLEEDGYIRRHGRNGNSALYRSTLKSSEQRNTPYPPSLLTDPHEEERGCVSELVKLFLLKDLYAPATQNKIIKNCRTILDRFETNQEEA